MKSKLTYTLGWFTLIACMMYACKEPYTIPPITGADKILVVEGVFNSTDTTKIRLSRSAEIEKFVTAKPETGAKVTIDGENGQQYTLTDNKNGLYTLAPVTASTSQKYRLKIQTTDGKVYLSEFVPLRTAPPIENISWERNNEGVTIYANTHDAINESRFYRWEWEETWKFQTIFSSKLEWVSKGPISYTVRDLLPNNSPYYSTCWRSESSTKIILESTVKFNNNIVSKKPITFIPAGSQKLGMHYSILARQYTLSSEAFKYWENIRKNSSDLGSIFSPQPSEIQGNLSCSGNPEIVVIGYFEACNATKKRIFIESLHVPDWKYRPNCSVLKVLNDADSLSVVTDYIPLDYADLKEIRIYFVPPACANCAVEGSPTKPAFWP